MITLLSRYVNNLRKDRRAQRSAARQTLPPPQRASGIPKRSLMICTPPEARGSILRDCNHLWRQGPPHRDAGRIKAPFAGTICSTSYLKPLLFEHGREVLNRVRGREILRTSPYQSSKKFSIAPSRYLEH